ncbi:SRPBCC domain-containing protein [Nocardia carnea]|uniref:SRPBCC domain-containing protein n=1 Tax=Nocardia carnea TaxID=37328 RepID=UPI0020D0C814|nr:SRPBCC domain-containing protein [Nocardia carnea]
MTLRPSGRLQKTPDGQDLILTRTYRAPITDVWASITESERTARWFGPWKGEAGPGRTIQVQLAYEEEQPWADFTIDACTPPHHLSLRTVDEHGSWHLEAALTERDGQTAGVHPPSDSAGDRRRSRPRLGVLPGYARQRTHRRGPSRIRRLLPRHAGLLREREPGMTGSPVRTRSAHNAAPLCTLPRS